MRKPDQLTIYRLNNGFVVKDSDGLNVFESIDEDERGYDAANICYTLRHINSWLGQNRDNRYSARRVFITTEPGDKFEQGEV